MSDKKKAERYKLRQNPVFRRNVKHEPMGLTTLMSYLTGLTKLVETRIKDLLPEKFSLVFDGWSAGSTHFVAVFASFTSEKEDSGYETRLLGFSPFEDETSCDGDHHIEFIKGVLEIYGKGWTKRNASRRMCKSSP